MTIRDRIKDLRRVKASTLVPNGRNWRVHPDDQRQAMAGVLEEIGYAGALIVRELDDGRLKIIDGHLRAETTPDEQVPVLVLDVDEQEADKLLATYDPLAAMAQADSQKLGELLAGIQTESEAVQAMLAGLAEENGIDLFDTKEPTEDIGAEVDRADELLEKWEVTRGQVWQIGDHRLLCGDSTVEADVELVMDGARAELCLSDPPYGIKRDKGFGGFGGFGPPIARRSYKDKWDAERPSQTVFDAILKNAIGVILFGGNYFADMLPPSTHWLVWDKKNTMPTFGDCELLWTNSARHSVKKYEYEYNGLIGKEPERWHPTQKPVALLVAIIGDYSQEGETIFDPFLGSGTTMVAAEQLGRRCFGVEISEKYCAVILERLSKMGLECHLEDRT